MVSRPFGTLLDHVRHAAGPASDAALLDQFLRRRDEESFTTLVRRFGPTVMAACRRVLGDGADVEDAVQATFLVLWRSAGSIRSTQSVGGWLYGVAHRVAVRARSAACRRRKVEGRAGAARPQEAREPADLTWREACDLLHEELDRLPDKFRLPLLLCYLDGLTRDEAAARLGWSVGAVKGNLERGRQRLRDRLARRGVTLSAGLLAAVAAPARSAVPAQLLDSVVSLAFGTATTSRAALLAQGVVFAMKMQQFKSLAATVLIAGAIAVGVGIPVHGALADKPAPPAADAAGAPAQPGKPNPLTVKGRVVGPDGAPVAGAKIMQPAFPLLFRPGQSPAAQVVATTDRDGRFEVAIPPTPFGLNFLRQLTAVADGFAADWADPAQAQGEMQLRLAADDVPVRGRIVDLEGQPVARLKVQVQAIETTSTEDLDVILKQFPTEAYRSLQRADKKLVAPRAAGLPASVTTDADGHFEVRGVGRGRFLVLRIEGEATEHVTLRVYTKPGFDPKSIAPPDGNRPRPGMAFPEPRPRIYGPEFVHVAQPAPPITGVVRDRVTGQPVAGATVNGSVQNGWWENGVTATTDAQGRYRLVGVPKVPNRRVSVFPEGSVYLASAVAVADQEGLGPVVVDVGLIRGVVVSGRITDKVTGKPLRAGIHYTPLKGNPHFEKTPGTDIHRFASVGHSAGADGRFRLVVLPGPGLITAQTDSRDETAGRYTEAKLDPADKPWADVSQLSSLGASFTAADGHIETLMGRSAYKIIDPAAGTEALKLEMQFDPGRSVTGTIVDADGKPVEGCRIAGRGAVFDRQQQAAGTTFTAVALDPERPRTVAAWHSERKLGGSLKLGGNETNPTITMKPLAAATGRLLDAEGKPVVGAQVMVYYRDRSVMALTGSFLPDRVAAETDRDGRFRVEGVFPGTEFSVGFTVRNRPAFPAGPPKLTVAEPGQTKDLGDISARMFGT